MDREAPALDHARARVVVRDGLASTLDWSDISWIPLGDLSIMGSE